MVYWIYDVPDHLKRQEICNEVVPTYACLFEHVPYHFNTQEMCEKAVEKNSWALEYIPDHIKTQEMCEKAVKDYTFSLQYVPDWFVNQQQIKTWGDDDYWNYKMINWCNGYEKRKAQKASIKEELMLISWHPSRH